MTLGCGLFRERGNHAEEVRVGRKSNLAASAAAVAAATVAGRSHRRGTGVHVMVVRICFRVGLALVLASWEILVAIAGIELLQRDLQLMAWQVRGF